MTRERNERGRPDPAVSIGIVLLVILMTAGSFFCEVSYAALSTTKKWGSDITDKKLNKYNGRNYYKKLPIVNQYACTGYTEWALNSVYGIKVPGYASTRALREYFIKKGNKVVAYGRRVAKAQGGNGKYYSYGEIKPGDIVFFFRRKTGKGGKITKSPIGSSRGYTKTSGWVHVAIVGGSVSGSHGISSKLHHNTSGKGIHYGGTIRYRLSVYGDKKGATDYQVMRVIEPKTIKRPVKIIKSMKVNGNVLPEEKAVFRIWPQKYGKYSSKSSWWKKIPSDYKDSVTTDSNGKATTEPLPTASDSFNGKYYIYQTKGPDGVKRVKNKGITLKKGTAAVEWKYTDESSEHPSIIKKDAATGDAVTQEGICFRLKRKGAFSNLQAYLAGGSSSGDDDAEEDQKEGEETGEDAAENADEIISAFLSDDPESKLKELGVIIDDAAWVTIDGQSEFITDDSGEAEIKSIKEEDIGEYEVYEISSPDGYKLPGYAVAAADPESASELDLPVDMKISSLASVVTVSLSDMPDPEIGTEALDDTTEGHNGAAIQDAGITDNVYLGNLEEGKAYTVCGKLVFSDTGKPVVDSSGKEVSATASFESEERDETVQLEFHFDGRTIQGKDVVVFERLYEGDFDDVPDELEPLAVHEDLNDKDQTVSYPDGHTSAQDHETGSHEGSAVKNARIDDVFYYENLEPGTEYVLTGKLYKKESGEAVRSDGEEVVTEVVFKPESENGEVPVTFTLDASMMDGEEIVAGEVLEQNGKTVLVHKNMNDEAQTISYPEKPDDENEEPDEPSKPSRKKRKTKRKYYSSPKTGDDQMELLVLLITVLIAAVLILVIMVLAYRDRYAQKTRKRG